MNTKNRRMGYEGASGLLCLSSPLAAIKPEADVVEELFHQFWFEFGARLCDAEFFARNIPPLQAAYGDAAVGAALRRHEAMIRSAASSQIRCYDSTPRGSGAARRGAKPLKHWVPLEQKWGFRATRASPPPAAASYADL
jgi:hypothetical protein